MKKSLLKKLLIAPTLVVSLLTMGCSSTKDTKTTESDTSTTTATTETSTEKTIKNSLSDVTVKVGTSGLFGPFSYYDTDGTTLIGYDLDLISALQDYLGFKIENDSVQAMDYSALTTSVAEGKLDMAAAALCVTDERKEVMDFSETYCDSGQSVMVNKTANSVIKSVDDLAGKTVAVEKGTASHAYAQKNLTDCNLEIHDTITTAYESLEQNKVDALIQDGPGCAFYLKTTASTSLEVVGDEFNQGQAPYAIAFKKDFKYLDEFNAALEEFKTDGTLDSIYDKWCK